MSGTSVTPRGGVAAALAVVYIGAGLEYLGVCALALAAIAVIPETVRHPDQVISVRPRLGVPPGMRAVMAGACLGVFAAFSILGSFSSLVPTFLHGILGVHNFALIGAASFLMPTLAWACPPSCNPQEPGSAGAGRRNHSVSP